MKKVLFQSERVNTEKGFLDVTEIQEALATASDVGSGVSARNDKRPGNSEMDAKDMSTLCNKNIYKKWWFCILIQGKALQFGTVSRSHLHLLNRCGSVVFGNNDHQQAKIVNIHISDVVYNIPLLNIFLDSQLLTYCFPKYCGKGICKPTNLQLLNKFE